MAGKEPLYKLGKKIGKGAYGTVYKGVNINTGAHVAIKKMTKTPMVERELKFLKFLQDYCEPYILCYTDTFLTRSKSGKIYIWIVTEYLDDWLELNEFMTKADEFAIEDFEYENKVELLLNIARAVKRLHSLGIIHKDLKLENIMVDPDLRIKILDLGMACWAEEEKYLECAERQGSPQYTDPHLMLQDGYSNRHEHDMYAIDIYSLGIVFFMILTERISFSLPFEPRSGADVFRAKKIIMDTIEEELTREMRDEFGFSAVLELVHNMTNPDPDKRPTINRVVDVLGEEVQTLRDDLQLEV